VLQENVIDLFTERVLMGFREAFIRLRKERGWTQQHVADEIGISVGQVKKYEKGDSSPNLPVLAKIATVFGVSADDLVFGGRNGLAANKLDADLLRRFEMLDQLSERERDAVLLLLDSVIAKHRLREVMGRE